MEYFCFAILAKGHGQVTFRADEITCPSAARLPNRTRLPKLQYKIHGLLALEPWLGLLALEPCPPPPPL